MNTERPLIVVVGATGIQGGSVVNQLIDTMQFSIRGLTRHTTSEAAKKQASRGVEMVKCDLNSLDDLTRAFQGAYGVFAMTDFWQREVMANPKLEVQQGRNIADAAKRTGVQHLVYSSLPDAKKISHGKYTGVLHFNNKAEVETYMKSLQLPATYVNFGYYMSNWTSDRSMYRHAEHDDYEVDMPVAASTLVPPFDALGDGGRCVVHCFRNPRATIGQSYDLAVEYMTLADMAETLSRVTRKNIRVKELTPEECTRHPIYKLTEITEMYHFIREFGYFGGRSLERTNDTFGTLLNFEDYLIENQFDKILEQ
ncbi:hypothetical protein IWQ60_010288 [Tieghemiomyces parasiticus]|uniref:NmrA-like domain-containing protein n=1 Tax=Tieghemiomyces parasiticus TaxID=78921 RepID=A0A9W7ZQS1_9FUNG|nr:hypothetical protein IWQ60_010288 [Tieghemiomyces parasiticus]